MPPPEIPYRPYDGLTPSSMEVVETDNAIGSLKSKTVLITGCSSGIGVETARALYECGATLFLTARDMQKLETTIDDIVANARYNQDGPRPQAIEMNLNTLQSVRSGATRFLSMSKHLNILICNAGVMGCPFDKTIDGFEMHLGINHLAHFLLFAILKDRLVESARMTGTSSRVINVASGAHRNSGIQFDNINFEHGDYDKWIAYGQSKTANIYMANAIHRRYADQGIIGLSLHPGRIRTGVTRHLTDKDMQRFSSGGVPLPVKTLSQGAATTVWAAVARRFDDPVNGGRYLSDVGECGLDDGTPHGSALTRGYAYHAYDKVAEEKLWKVSEEMVAMSA